MSNAIYQSATQDLSSNLSLNKLKEIIEPFRSMKMLIAITCRPEFYDYLLKLPELKTETGFDNTFDPEIFVIYNQKQNIKYWYNNQKQELVQYLKKNK